MLFTVCNSARVLAYLPQIRKAAIDRNGASAISYTTWNLFLVANLATIAYAVVNHSDWRMAACFTANALCCVAIVAAAWASRRRLRRRMSEQWRAPILRAPTDGGALIPVHGSVGGKVD